MVNAVFGWSMRPWESVPANRGAGRGRRGKLAGGRKLSQGFSALFEDISFQVTLDLLEGHELTSGDLRPPSLDRRDPLRGGFVPGKVLNAQVPPQRALDERGARNSRLADTSSAAPTTSSEGCRKAPGAR
jgi:hypothetical protein